MSLPLSFSADLLEGAGALHLQHSQPMPTTVVVSAHGYVDASNATRLHTYVRSIVAPQHNVLVLDLFDVEFFGTEGLSVLQMLKKSLTPRVRMAVVPNAEVSRLLRLCPVGSTPAVTSDVDAALVAAQLQPRAAALRLVAAENAETEPLPE